MESNKLNDPWLPTGVWIDELPRITPKCECGMGSVLGKDDIKQAHSDWCPVKITWEEDEMIREALKNDSEKKK